MLNSPWGPSDVILDSKASQERVIILSLKTKQNKQKKRLTQKTSHHCRYCAVIKKQRKETMLKIGKLLKIATILFMPVKWRKIWQTVQVRDENQNFFPFKCHKNNNNYYYWNKLSHSLHRYKTKFTKLNPVLISLETLQQWLKFKMVFFKESINYSSPHFRMERLLYKIWTLKKKKGRDSIS